MPELPEVETVVRMLAPRLSGRVVRRARILDPKLRPFVAKPIIGARFEEPRRVGKWAVLPLEKNGRLITHLCVHLRMTGRLLFIPEGARPSTRHLRARLTLDEGELWFVDPRRFGHFELRRDLASITPDAIDPTSRAFSLKWLAQATAGSSQPAKVWLMRQDRLVGIGNIYASEILHAAHLDPRRPIGGFDDAELKLLHRQTKDILRKAIKNCGTTFSDFQGSDGRIGGYQRYLRVYGRDGEPCAACNHPIRRLVQAQRSTFFCPVCQH